MQTKDLFPTRTTLMTLLMVNGFIGILQYIDTAKLPYVYN